MNQVLCALVAATGVVLCPVVVALADPIRRELVSPPAEPPEDEPRGPVRQMAVALGVSVGAIGQSMGG